MNEHRCILAHADGTCERVQCDQRKVATLLGGALTFAGAAGSNVVVVARVDDDPDTPVNALFGTHRHLFFEDATPPRGNVLFVGDVEGDAAHVDEDVLRTAGVSLPPDAARHDHPPRE